MLSLRVAKTSVGCTGGTGYIFTNCHLLVLHADINDITSFKLCDPSYEGEYDCRDLETLPNFLVVGVGDVMASLLMPRFQKL